MSVKGFLGALLVGGLIIKAVTGTDSPPTQDTGTPQYKPTDAEIAVAAKNYKGETSCRNLPAPGRDKDAATQYLGAYKYIWDVYHETARMAKGAGMEYPDVQGDAGYAMTDEVFKVCKSHPGVQVKHAMVSVTFKHLHPEAGYIGLD